MTAPGAGHSARLEKSGTLARLRSDFDLAILLSFGGVAAVVVSGFAVYRFMSGNLAGGLTNSAIVLAMVAPLAFAWYSGDTRRAGTVYVFIVALACVASALMFGTTGSFWAFLVLWINFVLTSRQIAVAVNLALIAAIVGQPGLFDSGTERAAYAVTALLVTVYGWIFSSRFSAQRIRLETLASHDPLTNAGNRRLLQHDLETVVASRRDRDPDAVLAVLDLDHFKRVNDTHGHEAGDRVLIRLVEIARGRLRKIDGLYRLGGEEFVVLLAHIGREGARKALGDLHEVLNAGLAEMAEGVTVSIGAAPLKSGEDWSTWLGRADAAMYRAKQSGRNRVAFFGDVDAQRTGRRAGDDPAT